MTPVTPTRIVLAAAVIVSSAVLVAWVASANGCGGDPLGSASPLIPDTERETEREVELDAALRQSASRTAAAQAVIDGYEGGAFDLREAARRFDAATPGDPATRTILRREFPAADDDERFARVVVWHAATRDAERPHRPPVAGRAAAEFERLFVGRTWHR